MQPLSCILTIINLIINYAQAIDSSFKIFFIKEKNMELLEIDFFTLRF